MDSPIYNEIIERIRSKFIEFDVDFDQFNNLLQKYNAFISGSFLLQVIQNEFYFGSDIDIFTFGEKNINFENEINDIIKKSFLQKILKKNINIIKEPIKTRGAIDENIIDLYQSMIKSGPSMIDLDELNEYPNNNKIVNKNADIDKIDFNRPISLNTKLIKGWKPDNTDFVNMGFKCISCYEKIESKYKSINRCSETLLTIFDNDKKYNCHKINEIVEFVLSDNIISKYQIIYYDETIKTPEDILEGFDFEFCANYWDGKKLFIKNLNSINSKSGILNLNKPRIYKNQNKRIVKYIDRNFKININYNGDIYEVICLDNMNLKKTKISDTTSNLVLILRDSYLSIKPILDNLPFGLEKLIIYTHNNEEIIDNLPITLQELRLYLWNYGSGIEEGFKTKKCQSGWEKHIKTMKKSDMAKENNAIKNLKKIPFGCNVYVNDKLIEL